MLNFFEPTLRDKQWADKIFLNSGYMGSDNAFGTAFIWKDAYNLKICRYKDFLLRMYSGEKIFYGFPLGRGDLRDAVDVLINDAYQRKTKLAFTGLTKSMMDKLNDIMPNAFEYENTRNTSDYIYNVNDLINLKGKKYHSKRNHIAKFKRLYTFEYEDINRENINECRELLNKWYDNHNYKNNESLLNERTALNLTLDNLEKLNFIGAILKVDGMAIAMTIGEKINNDVFVVHFEKALEDYIGAYTVINNEFVKHSLADYKFVNREEDLGIEGLRKSKLSYYPQIILEKYNAFLR